MMHSGWVPAPRRMGQGFTLIEVMVTVAIVVILTVIAVPGMLNLFRDARLSTQTDLLVGALNSARLEAVRQGGNGVKVCTPDAVGTACLDQAGWSNGLIVALCSNSTCSTLGTVLQNIAAKTGTTVTVSAGVNTVRFFGAIGNAAATTINVCAAGRDQQQVVVTASGHVAKVRPSPAVPCQ